MKMKIVQITDTHLVPRGEVLHGLDPCERLDACIDDINRHHRDAELCIITGDLVHNGQSRAYRDLKGCLSRLEIPCHLLVGNHDHRGRLLDEFPDSPVDENGFLQTVIETDVGRFFLLDTIEQGKAWGAYCERRLAWLKNAIEAARGCPVYLFMHHPPFSVGLPCVDRLGLGTDGERLAEVVVPYANIRHLFFGHVHRPVTGSWRGIPYSTMRGTNHQVPFDFDAVEVVPKSHEQPAYAVVFLEEHQTTVHFHDYLDTYRVPYNKKTEGRPTTTFSTSYPRFTPPVAHKD